MCNRLWFGTFYVLNWAKAPIYPPNSMLFLVWSFHLFTKARTEASFGRTQVKNTKSLTVDIIDGTGVFSVFFYG